MFGADGIDPGIVQGGALGILALVVWWFIKSSDRNYADDRTDRDRLASDKASLEAKLEAAQQELSEQRKAKHDALGKQAAAEGTLGLVRTAASRCTCGALAPLAPLLERRPVGT